MLESNGKKSPTIERPNEQTPEVRANSAPSWDWTGTGTGTGAGAELSNNLTLLGHELGIGHRIRSGQRLEHLPKVKE